MGSPLHLLSPAKLNLFLHITGRRADGYHELQTIFQLLDWGDDMSFEPDAGDQVTLAGDSGGVAPADNLIARAAALLDTRGRGVKITLRKRIPVGGGLGGGSSNAATALLALNHLLGLGHSTRELAALGARLGADVPVFVAGCSAWAEGIGEHLTPVDLPSQWFLVIVPQCSVSTAEIFSNEQLTRNSAPIRMSGFLQGHSRNDCQELVRSLYPEIDKALIFLEKFGDARLTGTGACVFAGFASDVEARAVQQQLPEQWQSFIARGVNRSPVHAALV